MFTDSDSLANAVKKDVGQSHDKRFRIVVSMLREGFREAENYITAMVADTFASCGSFDEDDGKGHPRLILQQSCISPLWPRRFLRAEQPQKMFNVAAKRVSIAAHENLTPLFSFLFVYCEYL